MTMTAKEVAKILDISQATLSLVINNKPGVSEKTRQRVIQMLTEAGFESMIKEESSYSEQQNKNIGFIIYRKGGQLLGFNSFFPLIIDSLQLRARKYGYNLHYINVSHENVKQEINSIKDADCVGYVIFATEMQSEDLIPFKKMGIPYVLLDNHFDDEEINVVKVNNQQGTFLSVKHLYERGHRKIGYLRSGLQIRSFTERYKSAMDAMKQFGINDAEKYVFEVGYPSENAVKNMKEIIESGVELPTAFLADNDLISVGAMKALNDAGIDVPGEISFIGFDDRPICTLINPQLTTIQLPREIFGSEAMELLHRILVGEDNLLLKVEISGKLLIRDTVVTFNS